MSKIYAHFVMGRDGKVIALFPNETGKGVNDVLNYIKGVGWGTSKYPTGLKPAQDWQYRRLLAHMHEELWDDDTRIDIVDRKIADALNLKRREQYIASNGERQIWSGTIEEAIGMVPDITEVRDDVPVDAVQG